MSVRKRKRKSKRGAGKQLARGRPTAYTPALGQAIAERMAAGEPLVAICADSAMPDRVTVWRWQLHHRDFCNMIMVAREWGADALSEQVLGIADNLAGDVGRDRLRVTARMWLASKIAPRRYGERISQEISGPGGGPVPMAMVSVMPPIEVSKAVAALLVKAQKQLGLAARARTGKGARALEILNSGKALPPEVYAALYAAGKGSDG